LWLQVACGAVHGEIPRPDQIYIYIPKYSNISDLVLTQIRYIYTKVFQRKAKQRVTRAVLRTSLVQRNSLIMESAAQSIGNLFDLDACSANLSWLSFENTTV
jgi:hypothetical protein